MQGWVPMRSLPIVIAAAFVAATFSGCIIPDLLGGGGAIDPAPIVKKATLTIDTSMEDADTLSDVLDVVFEYRHEGEDLDPAQATVEFRDEAGEERSRPLSDFTTLSLVRDGDMVVVPNVNITSGLVVRGPSGVLQERSGMDQDWFHAAGYPIPLTVSEPAVARYSASASSDMDFSAADFSPDESFTLDTATASFDARFDGTIDATSSFPAAGPRIEFAIDSQGGLEAEADAVYTEEGQRINTGGRIDVDAESDHTLTLQFDAARALQSIAANGRMYADGDIIVWDQDHPKEEQYRPEEIEHPLIDETYSESETIEWNATDVEQEWAAFLARLWDARIDAGDEYRLEFLMDEDGFYLRYEVVVQVTHREDRDVAAGTFDSFRITQTTNFVVRSPGEDQADFEVSKFTYWIAADSGLPVFAQGSVARTFDEDDLAGLVERFGGFGDESAPRDLQWVAQADSTMELQEYSGDLATSPWFSANAIGGPAAGVMAAMVFVLVSDIGGGYSDYAEVAPSVAFVVNDSQDRITVTAYSADADWNRLALRVDQDGIFFSLNEEATSFSSPTWGAGQWTYITYETHGMQTGDFLSFCQDGTVIGPVQVTLKDDWANQDLFESAFSSLDVCS